VPKVGGAVLSGEFGRRRSFAARSVPPTSLSRFIVAMWLPTAWVKCCG